VRHEHFLNVHTLRAIFWFDLKHRHRVVLRLGESTSLLEEALESIRAAEYLEYQREVVLSIFATLGGHCDDPLPDGQGVGADMVYRQDGEWIRNTWQHSHVHPLVWVGIRLVGVRTTQKGRSVTDVGLLTQI
jgi:hypothetical protein